jgi:hypothetical protein
MRRLLPIIGVLLLCASGWSQVFAAALCPHVLGAHACCFAQQATHHHDHAAPQAEMPMDGMEMRPTAAPTDEVSANSLGQPEADCAHCMGHSQLPAATTVASATVQPKRSVEADAPLVAPLFAPPALALTSLISQRPHAPPGAVGSARHVLINVFRI